VCPALAQGDKVGLKVTLHKDQASGTFEVFVNGRSQGSKIFSDIKGPVKAGISMIQMQTVSLQAPSWIAKP